MSFTRAKVAQPDKPSVDVGALWPDSADGYPRFLTEQGKVYGLADTGPVAVNYILNGGFEFLQRQDRATLTTYALTGSRNYTADRWAVRGPTNSIQLRNTGTESAPEAGITAQFYARYRKITADGKLILHQPMEAAYTVPLRNRIVTLQAKIKHSGVANTWRLGLRYTTGTAPTVVPSVYGANGVDPTWDAALIAVPPVAAYGAATISGEFLNCVSTTAWQQFGGSFSIPSAAQILFVLVFSGNGMSAAGVEELRITEAGLYQGEELQAWQPRPSRLELLLCQRYYCKTFSVHQNPIDNLGVNTGELKFMAGIAGAGAERGGHWRFPTPMRIAPGVSFYNPSAGAGATIRDETAAADTTGGGIVTTANELTLNCTGAAGTVVGGLLGVHFAADAEL